MEEKKKRGRPRKDPKKKSHQKKEPEDTIEINAKHKDSSIEIKIKGILEFLKNLFIDPKIK